MQLNLMKLAIELRDVSNVTDGKLYTEYGVHPDEIDAEQHNKLVRTVMLIEEAKRTGKSYDEVRYS